MVPCMRLNIRPKVVFQNDFLKVTKVRLLRLETFLSCKRSGSCFLVGAFLVKRARLLLQWLVFFFFRQTTDLIVYVPLFSTDFIRFTVNPAVTGSSPCFSQKLFRFRAFAKADETEGSPRPIFFGTVGFFFEFLLSPKGPRSIISIFCNKLDFQKAPRVPFFQI